ncbi:MAG: hypothetical protein COA33_009320 [Fluviicola sp.]|nr:hypothetical protein [Fluviicola sp.]
MKILSINYSQSGQLDDILSNFLSSIKNCEIDRIKIEAQQSFAFPWKVDGFYNIMPETVLEEAISLKEIHFKEEKYDLIILGYQPWFLSPSMPTSSLLQLESFKKRVNGTKVMTVIGARNMWLNSQTSVVKHIHDAGGEMIANLALTDRAPNQLSAVSIVHWMMTGKKTKKWGVFPLPGISDEDIKGASFFGAILNESIQKNDFKDLQKQIIEKKGTKINVNILFIENKAKKIFNIWAKLIKKKEAQGKKRSFWISFFRYYLNFALFFVAPILLFLYTLLLRPFLGKKIKRQIKHFLYIGIETD